MNVLITDPVFPNKYAKWRLVEIKSFIDKYKCDILCCSRLWSYKGIKLDFDYNILSEYFNLGEYDILIFNPSLNHINTHNTSIDGTIFNNKLNADYMLRHKRNRSSTVSLNNYDIIYHIFLLCYNEFNLRFRFPHKKQVIHLYSGGGYINPTSICTIHKDVKIVATQEFISRNLSGFNHINIYGGPFYYKDEKIIYKDSVSANLSICFTSLGDSAEKGAYIYHNIVTKYIEMYPTDSVNFISIGSCPSHPNITSLPPMDQTSLSLYYRNIIDVIISLDTGVSLNGFPLGIEAVQQGCVLLTTDIHGQNEKNMFYIDNFHIIDKNNVLDIVKKIKYLTNKNICLQKGKELQEKIYELFKYENIMEPIFKYINHPN